MATDVWVLCEHAGGRLRKIAHELLGKARELAGRLGGRAAAVALGEGSGALAEEAGTHGADVLYALDSPALSSYTTDSYVAALAPLLQRERPFLLLVGSTALGRDLAPRLAARLRAGIVTDCTSVELQEGRVVVTRPVMTRKAIARVAFRGEGPKIAVVLPNVLQPAPPVADAPCGDRGRGPGDGLAHRGGRHRLGRARDARAGALHDAGGAGGPPRRRRGLQPASGGLGVGPPRLRDRADGQDRQSPPLHRMRHLGGPPAPRGHVRVALHRGHQQGPPGPDLRGRLLRHRGGRV